GGPTEGGAAHGRTDARRRPDAVSPGRGGVGPPDQALAHSRRLVSRRTGADRDRDAGTDQGGGGSARRGRGGPGGCAGGSGAQGEGGDALDHLEPSGPRSGG